MVRPLLYIDLRIFFWAIAGVTTFFINSPAWPASPSSSSTTVSSTTSTVTNITSTPLAPSSCKLVGRLESCDCAENTFLFEQLAAGVDRTFRGTVSLENGPNPRPEYCKIALSFSGPGIVKTSGAFTEGYNGFWFTVNPSPAEVRGPWTVTATPTNCGYCGSASFTAAVPYLDVEPDDGDWIVTEKTVMSDQFKGTLRGIPGQCRATWTAQDPDSLPIVRLDKHGNSVPIRNLSSVTPTDSKMLWRTATPNWTLKRAFWYGRDEAFSFPEEHSKPYAYYNDYMCIGDYSPPDGGEGPPNLHFQQSKYDLRFKGYVDSGNCRAAKAIDDELLEVRTPTKLYGFAKDFKTYYAPYENLKESRGPNRCCIELVPNKRPIRHNCKIRKKVPDFQYKKPIEDEEDFHCRQHLDDGLSWAEGGKRPSSCPRMSSIFELAREYSGNSSLKFCSDYEKNVRMPDTMACARARAEAKRVLIQAAEEADLKNETAGDGFFTNTCWLEVTAKRAVGLTRFGGAGFHVECAHSECFPDFIDRDPATDDFIMPPEPCY